MELKQILEAVLFSAQKPLSSRELRDLLTAATQHGEDHPQTTEFRKVNEPVLNAALEELLGGDDGRWAEVVVSVGEEDDGAEVGFVFEQIGDGAGEVGAGELGFVGWR